MSCSWGLRRASGADASAVAAAHVRSWQAAYRGIVPDDFLDNLDVGARAGRYAFDLVAPDDPETWIAVEGEVVLGLVTVSPSRDEDLRGMGEVRALYVIPDRWRSGVGSALMVEAVQLLLDRGFTEAALWVLEDNARGRRFYEAAGWRPDGGTQRLAIGGRELGEVRYRKALTGEPSALPAEVPAIHTERLELVSMSLAFMRALAAGDLEAATREVGAVLTPDLPGQLSNFLGYRIPMLEADPASQPWLGRAIVWIHPDGRRQVIGTIGFHAPPDATERVEIGYRVEAAFRRRGIATECVRALLAWAESQGIHRFRASVAPGNVASLAIIRSFGFSQVGVQVDEIDGEELVFHLDRPAGERD